MIQAGHRWRAAAAAIGISLLAVGSLAPGVQASSLAVTFHADSDGCVSGTISFSLTVRLDLHNAADSVVSSSDDPIPLDPQQRYQVCFGIDPFPGWRVVAVDTSTLDEVSYTIPDLSVRVDRVTDKVSGRAQANRALTVKAYDCTLTTGKTCPRVVTRTVHSSATGHYTTDLTSAFDLRGMDQVRVTRTSSNGDSWTILQGVPMFEVFADTKVVVGAIDDGQHARLRLRSRPGGAVLSSVSVTDDMVRGRFGVTLGSYLRAGRQLTSDLAGDARVTIPSTATAFVIEHHDQTIKTHCLPGRKMVIEWSTTHTRQVTRTTDSQGRATVNLSSIEHNGYRLPHGTSVSTWCATAAGDVIDASANAP